MDRGDASALLIIPKGFQDAFLHNQPSQLQLLTNPAQSILPNIIEQTLSIVVDGGFYLQKLAAVPLRSLATARRPSDATVARSSVAFSQIGPEPVEIPESSSDRSGSDMSSRSNAKPKRGGTVFARDDLHGACCSLRTALAATSGRSSRWGTLRRLATTPVSLGAFLGGRLISLTLILCRRRRWSAVAGMRWFAHVPVASVPLAPLWLIVSGAAFYLFLLAIAVHASSQRSGERDRQSGGVSAGAAGRLFFPFEMMPDWMASIGRFTPNGWAVTQFKAIRRGLGSYQGFLAGAAYVAVVGIASFPSSPLRRLRRLF